MTAKWFSDRQKGRFFSWNLLSIYKVIWSYNYLRFLKGIGFIHRLFCTRYRLVFPKLDFYSWGHISACSNEYPWHILWFQDFFFFLRGGGGSILCARTHITRVKRDVRLTFLWAEVQDPLKGSGRCSFVLSGPYFKYSDTKWNKTKQNMIDQNSGSSTETETFCVYFEDVCATPFHDELMYNL